MQPITEAIDIRTEAIPLVEKWDTDERPRYVVSFPDAGVSATLTEAQVRGLVKNALAAQLDELEDD